MKQRSVPIQINIQRRYPLLADSHTVDLGRLPRIDTDIVRVERALSSESDPVTQSASFRTRTGLTLATSMSIHVMPSPPTHPRPRLTPDRPDPSPLSRPSLSPFKTPRCHAVRLSSHPDDMCAPLDTGQVAPCTSRSTPCQSDVPARDIHFFGLVVAFGIISFASVCFHLSYFCL